MTVQMLSVIGAAVVVAVGSIGPAFAEGVAAGAKLTRVAD
jgi:F0F1-type ATP synthase membrane subunit c/vacuolar-type H+-ATPase subunit K